MVETADRTRTGQGNVESTLPSADHGLPGGPVADGKPDPADTTSILYGAQLFGKTAWQAGRMAVNEAVFGTYAQARQVQDKREAQERRERENLAVWNRQMTTSNGVRMTNGEAQEARQHVLDNADRHVDQAIAAGKLTESDREEFKRVIARKKELEDKRGRGTMTAAEAEESRRMDDSRIGKVANELTAQAHLDRQRATPANVSRADANTALSQAVPPAPADESVFRTYQAATAPQAVPPQPVDARVKASGLDL